MSCVHMLERLPGRGRLHGILRYRDLSFGVPNRSLNTQNLETLVQGQNNAQLIADLTEGLPLLLHIDHAFQNGFTYKDCLIASFFETKDSNTVKVVPPHILCMELWALVFTVIG